MYINWNVITARPIFLHTIVFFIKIRTFKSPKQHLNASTQSNKWQRYEGLSFYWSLRNWWLECGSLNVVSSGVDNFDTFQELPFSTSNNRRQRWLTPSCSVSFSSVYYVCHFEIALSSAVRNLFQCDEVHKNLVHDIAVFSSQDMLYLSLADRFNDNLL